MSISEGITIGDLYGSLIKYALADDEKGHEYLKEVGALLFEKNPDKCKTLEQGIEQAKVNLDYYCQYKSKATADKVKAFYGLGMSYRYLFGKT
jgi:hypothetical protein